MWKNKAPRKIEFVQPLPIGSFLEVDGKYFYVSGVKQYMSISSKRVLKTWSPPYIVQCAPEMFKTWKLVGKLKPRNGVYVKNIWGNHTYFVEKGKKRPVKNPEWIEVYEAYGNSVIYLSAEEMELLPLGEPLV